MTVILAEAVLSDVKTAFTSIPALMERPSNQNNTSINKLENVSGFYWEQEGLTLFRLMNRDINTEDGLIFFLGGRGGGGGIFWFMKLWVVHDCSMGNSLCKNRPFAGSGHMIRNKLRGTQITEWYFQNKGKSGCTGG